MKCPLCSFPTTYRELQSVPVPKFHEGYGMGKYILACAECRKALEKLKRKKRGK